MPITEETKCYPLPMQAQAHEPTRKIENQVRSPSEQEASIEARLQADFLARYTKYGTVGAACKYAKVTRKMVSKWKKDADFADRFADAHEDTVDALEEEARDRAIIGQKRPKMMRDGVAMRDPVTHEPIYESVRSDVLLVLLLKGAKPDKYRESAPARPVGDDDFIDPLQIATNPAAADLARQLVTLLYQARKMPALPPPPSLPIISLEPGSVVSVDAATEDTNRNPA